MTGRAISFLLVVKFGNLHGIAGRFLLQTLKIFAGLLVLSRSLDNEKRKSSNAVLAFWVAA